MADSQTKHSTESSADADPCLPRLWASYVGWIPTVNGRLSFRHIGDSRHPTESICANLDLSNGRLIIAYQRRPLSDVLFPRIIHPYRGLSGDFWFVIAARTKAAAIDADAVSGQVFVYKSKDDWRSKADQKVRAHIAEINAQRFSLDNQRNQLAELSFDRATAVASNTADISVSFEILRDGTIFVSQPVFAEQALEEASVAFANASGLDLRSWVSNQVYFFLRDVSHNHQHHEPTSDNILVLQDYDASNDLEWRKKIIFSLHYAIIRFKRDDLSEQASYRALGILAYCKSFAMCCKTKLKDKFDNAPIFNEEALQLSLTAKANEISSRLQAIANIQTANMARASTLRTIALGIFAIIVAVIAILIQPRINEKDKATFPNLYEASTIAAENFFSFLQLGLLIVVVTWIYTHSDWAASTRTGRALLEASYIRKGRAVTLFLASAAALVAGGLWKFRAAVIDSYESLRDLISLFQ